jgi:hypothetical protein
MGIETLQSAARAAGFAMAAEDGDGECAPHVVEHPEWQPTQALLLPLAEPHQPGKLEALRGLFSYFGRRAPASPA